MNFDLTDFLLALVSVSLAVSTYFNTRKKDTRNEGAQQASFRADLTYIKEMLQDVRSNVKEITKSSDTHTEKIAKLEEQLCSAFRRIERLENQLDGAKES